MVEWQRQPHGLEYYQKSITGELSAKASETVGKLKHPSGTKSDGGTLHSQQQVGDADMGEDWENIKHKDLEKLQVMVIQLLAFILDIGVSPLRLHAELELNSNCIVRVMSPRLKVACCLVGEM